MRAFIFVDDSNDEQVMTVYEVGTGELRAVGFTMRHFTCLPCIYDKHRLAWRGTSSESSIPVRFFPTLFPQCQAQLTRLAILT